MNFRTAALAASALTIALVLAGCSATTTTTMPSDMPGMPGMDSPSNAAPQFNDSDIAFVMQMIPHHQQAVEMADILLDKTDVDSRVVELATQVKAAQGPEITTMTSWLETWGLAAPEPMEGMVMNGMMSPDEMDALTNASGPDSSKLFLQQMIQHHQGAIDMANEELSAGMNAPALTLAKAILDAQTAEIATMQSILDTL
ncbi:MAG: DUF305 domain-containing protein [Actinobacteria bacterium]|jgi:uncharacterized protein (DUF305 family)|nr:DUF305 domain-containing protein [Actinomycetota bacterium]